MNYFIRQSTSGILIGSLVVFLIGAFFSVRALSPGVVSNPSFTPGQDDVDLNMQLDCVTVIDAGTAVCPAGYAVTGGGMDCGNDGDQGQIIPDVTAQSVTSSCGGASENSYAVCCKVN